MKIAVVNRHVADAVGGSEVQCDLIARGLVRRGHEVRYLAVQGRTRRSSLPYDVEPVARSRRAIIRAIRESQPDVVYWRFDRERFAGTVRELANDPFVFLFAVSHVHNVARWPLLPEGSVIAGVWNRTARRVNERGFDAVDALVVNNADHLGRVAVDLQIHIPNGMVDEAVPFSWPRPYVAWVANLSSRKRPQACIPLANALRDLGVDVLMAGHLASPRYRRIAAGRRLPDNLHYLGPLSLPEVNGLLASARCHVHTCKPEGFSNVFIQAWLQGRPSVSLEFDPNGVIREHGLGVVADGDRAKFHTAVRELAGDEQRCVEVGRRAQEFARQEFDPERNIDRLEALMRRLHEGARQ